MKNKNFSSMSNNKNKVIRHKFAKKFENQIGKIEYGTSWTYETWKFAVLASEEGSEGYT